MDRWAWLLQYAVAFVLAVVLGAIFASSSLFQHTTLGTDRLTAANVARALGDAAALMILWFAAARAARALADDGSWRSLARATLLPLATLVVLGIGYGVPLFVLGPFLTPDAMMAYRWLFVLAIIATALWLAIAASRRAPVLAATVARLTHAARTAKARETPAAAPKTAPQCDQCGATVPPGATACEHCGRALAA